MNFDKNKQIEKMKPTVDKLVTYLKTKGIEFIPNDESGLENVIFKSSDKEFKMSKHSLNRFSGIAVVTRDKGANESETVEVTNDMYIQMFIKPIVETFFK